MEQHDICPICLDDIDNQYAIINNVGETEKYHSACLERWLTTKRSGIMNPGLLVETYSIYENGHLSQTIRTDTFHHLWMIYWNDVIDNFKLVVQNSFEYDSETEEETTETETGVLCLFFCFFCL
jgi:hypothetical protein